MEAREIREEIKVVNAGNVTSIAMLISKCYKYVI